MRASAWGVLTPISIRILAFNVLIVFLPIAGILSLGTYERQLLRALERSLVQQGRVLSASLEDSGPRLAQNANLLILRLRQRHDARLRIVDAKGRLLADSARFGTAEDSSPSDTTAPQQPRQAQETFLYRLASFPIRQWRRWVPPPAPPPESDEFYSGARVLLGPEVKDALAGGYGATTRVTSGQQSVTLYSAIPILSRGAVIGAVLVSQSTFRLLSDLYSLRLDIFRLFLWSVGTAVVLSLLVSATITVPLRRLRNSARKILDPRGRLLGGFVASQARDEIGELSRSLGELTSRLERYVRLLESFASDVSHEFRNPLASIRSAAELALATPEESERNAMLSMVLQDVDRLERLLTGVREISRIDSGVDEESASGPAEAKVIAELVAQSFRRKYPAIRFVVEGEDVRVSVAPLRLQQVLENLVDNAASFSPAAGSVRIRSRVLGNQVLLQVLDDGPGVQAEHRERIFTRFFSYRPGEERGIHSGLGLAIVKAIAESHGGTVGEENLPTGGACFEVRLPTAGSAA